MNRRASFIDIHGYNRLAARGLWTILVAEIVAAIVLCLLIVGR